MSFTDDLAVVDQTAIEQTGPQYVMGQWHNGDPKLAALGGVPHTGGLIIDRKYVSESVKAPAGWADTQVVFSSGKAVRVLAAVQPVLAVIRTRFSWFVKFNGVTNYFPRSAYQEGTGMRGKVQALCGVKGFDFPVVFTFTGKASQEFERALKAFSGKLRESAPAAGFPRYAFFLNLHPAPHTKVGQKGQESFVTPPEFDLPATLDAAGLEKLYVGKQRLQDMQTEWHKATEWAVQWDKAGEPEPEAADDTEAEPEPAGAPSQTAADMLGWPDKTKRPSNYDEKM